MAEEDIAENEDLPAEKAAEVVAEARDPSPPGPKPCPPCKSGSPPWMATFADMATLLMAFFVLILSFTEVSVPKYKQISGSLKAAFGVARVVPPISIPSARSIVIEDFSPAEAQRSLRKSPRQRSLDTTREFVVKKTQTSKSDFETQQEFLTLEKVLEDEIAEGQVLLKMSGDKLVVEIQSTDRAGGSTGNKDGDQSGGKVSQATIDIANKVVEAQSKIVSEIQVRRQDLSQGSDSAGLSPASLDENSSGEQDSDNLGDQEKFTQIKTDLESEIQQGLVEVEKIDDKVVVRLASQGSFRSGSADLQFGFDKLLTKVGISLREAGGQVRVEGHTDNVPVAFSERFQSNWDLSAARSAAVADFFINNSGIDQKNITVAGFAETRPIDSNTTRAGRAKNRRIEIIVD